MRLVVSKLYVLSLLDEVLAHFEELLVDFFEALIDRLGSKSSLFSIRSTRSDDPFSAIAMPPRLPSSAREARRVPRGFRCRRSASVAHDATGLDIERRLTDREA